MDIIKRADDHSVRAVLLYLCNDMQNRAKALSLLANLEKAQNVQIQPAASSAGRPKRKATKHLWVCVRCDDVFDEDNNGDQGCQFHDGRLEVDYDNETWDDYDENCQGTIDSDEMRQEYPQAFTWDCCDLSGDKPGCKRGKHQFNPIGYKKGNYKTTL